MFMNVAKSLLGSIGRRVVLGTAILGLMVGSNAFASPALRFIEPQLPGTFWRSYGSCDYEYSYQGQFPNGYYIVIAVLPKGCNPYSAPELTGVAATTDYTYLGELSDVAVYNKKGKQVGVLTGLTGAPIGITTDVRGNVWVTNFPSNAISAFAPGASTPTATYTDTLLSSMSFVTADQNSNIYISGQSASTGALEVDELNPATGNFVPLSSISGAIAGGIAFQAKTGLLWVCDEGTGSGGTISSYASPSFKRRTQFAYSGVDTGIAVPASGPYLYALNNVVSGSGYNVSGVVYAVKTGQVVASSPALNSAAEEVGIYLAK